VDVHFPGPDTTLLHGGYCIQDSFSVIVNGTVYDPLNPAGEEVMTNAMGCDSVVIIDLDFNTASFSSDTFHLCFGDTFPMISIPLYLDTTLFDTLYKANQFGCDSILEYFLTIAPLGADTIYPVICSGEGYSAGGISFNSSGIFEVILTGSNGCDSMVTIDLTVLPPASDSILLSICTGDSLQILDSILHDQGTYVFPAGTGQNGCDSFVVVELELLDDIMSFETYPLCPGDSLIFGDTIIHEPGSYTFGAGQASNGCDSILVLEITTPPLLIPDTVHILLCAGESATLMIGDEEIITIDGPGIFYDTAIANGFPCDSALVFKVAVAEPISLDSAEITSDDGSGSGRVIPFLSDPILTYTWSNGQTGQVISGLSSGTYGLTVTDINGCSSSFQFTVPLSTGIQDKWQGSAPLLVQNPIAKGDPIRIQPDPGKGQVDLIRLYSLNGSRVAEWNEFQRASSGILSLHLPVAGSGMYLLQVRQGGTWLTRKLIVL
jgi:hypothetical protein